jgi:geranylgeranyl diphosphate synthase type II
LLLFYFTIIPTVSRKFFLEPLKILNLYLYLKSIDSEDFKEELNSLFTQDYRNLSDDEMENKKERVKELFIHSGGANRTLEAINDYTEKALKTIEGLDMADANKAVLKKFSEELMSRIS